MTNTKPVPDTAAQNAIWVHAAAYSHILRIIEFCCGCVTAPIGELCCTRPDDPEYYSVFGIYLKGEVTAMFTQDTYSWFDRDTYKRQCDLCDFEEFQVFKYEDLKPSNMDPLSCTSGYTESWVIPHEVLGIWIYDSAAKKYPKDYQKLLDLGLPVSIISERKIERY